MRFINILLILFSLSFFNSNLAVAKSLKDTDENKGFSYLDFPHPVPGVIEAEFFDKGGEGVAYHNVTQINSRLLNQGSNCQRPNDSIELEIFDDRCVVSRSAYKEWLRYTLDIVHEGVYDVDVHYSNAGPKGSMFIALGTSKNIIKEIDLPSTNSDSQFEVVTFKNVSLKEGSHPVIFGFTESNQPMYNDKNTAIIMQMVGSTSHAQIDFIEFYPADHKKNLLWLARASSNPKLKIPGVIQAGHFDQHSSNSSYWDQTLDNEAFSTGDFQCGQLTAVDVVLKGGVCTVTHTEPGEWLTYSFSAEKEGVYDILFSTFSPQSGGKFYLQLNNRGVSTPLTVKKSINPLTPEVLIAKKIKIPSGTHTLKVVMLKASQNGRVGDFAHIEILEHFDRFEVSKN